ncbi:MAG: methyltransferase domain-containing protein [Treponema sp.]|nr:methyltransferase domain-containing protein [Treponema sp.]
MTENKKPVRAVVVQCRLSSTRLPNKALYILGGKPLIQWTLEAMKKVSADFYIVATDEASSAKLKPVCDMAGFDCFTGPLEDVLERFCMVVRQYKIDTVIRATGDNPFLFFEAASESADEFDALRGTENECAYLTYSGLPHGSGVEIFDGNSLLKAAAMTEDPYDHEHAGPAFYRHQENFRCHFKPAPEKYKAPNLRTTIDTFGDFLRAELLYNDLREATEKSEGPYSADEVLASAYKPKIMKPVILVPSVKPGRGTGHLVRCLKLARETGAFIYVPGPSDTSMEGVAFANKIASLVSEAIDNGLKFEQVIQTLPEKSFNCTYIADTFALKKQEVEYLSAQTLVALDDGSKYRDLCDYVFDIIPSLKADYKQNLKNISFLDLPESSGKKPLKNIEEIRKVLVCFGGEDPANLALPVSSVCQEIFPQAEIRTVTKASPVPDLKNHIHEYDLVFTHYGLTAFESLAAGTGVVLLPTTKLHEKLAQKYGFANCRLKKLNRKFLEEVLANGKIYNSDFFSENGGKLSASEKKNSLSGFVNILASGKSYSCPVCGKTDKEKNGKIVSRNDTRTYRRCPDCGMVYISYSCVPETKYEKEYFFESYKNQYGKTYKEDFENIKASCVKRVSVMNSIFAPEKESSVLDIGCAYGPFLKAASESGWKAYGTDICDDAVESVKKELGFEACVSAFPEIDTEKEFGKKEFDAVTMWYVIEHFQDLKSVLEKVSSLVKKGGVFAFSTPSGEGVSATTDKDHFYVISPTDHYSVWEPSKADAILRKFGFKVIKTVSTGHHPERFPEIKKSGAKAGSAEWEKIMNRSVKKNLGDTVEIYCVKQ